MVFITTDDGGVKGSSGFFGNLERFITEPLRMAARLDSMPKRRTWWEQWEEEERRKREAAQFAAAEQRRRAEPLRSKFAEADRASMEGLPQGGWELPSEGDGGFWGGVGNTLSGAGNILGKGLRFGQGESAPPEERRGLWDAFGAANESYARTMGTALGTDELAQRAGYDPSGLPNPWYFPAETVARQAATPGNYIGAMFAPSVPIIGSTFGGPFAARAAGEVGVSALGVTGSEQAAQRLPEDIPLVPDWADPYVRGGLVVGAGMATALGGIGAYKGARAGARSLDEAALGLDARINEPAGVMGPVTRGMEAPEGPRLSPTGDPIFPSLVDALSESARQTRARVNNVRSGPIIDGVDHILFDFDGVEYQAPLTVRKHLETFGLGSAETDKSIAVQTLIHEKTAVPTGAKALPEGASPPVVPPRKPPTVTGPVVVRAVETKPHAPETVRADVDGQRAMARAAGGGQPPDRPFTLEPEPPEPPRPGWAPLGDSGAQRAIAEKGATLRTAGTIGRVVGKIPGVARAAGIINPSITKSRTVMVAFTSRLAVQADLQTRFAGTRAAVLAELDTAFGKFVKNSDGYYRPLNGPKYIGPEGRKIAGTLNDIAENPQDYIITPAQRTALDNMDVRNTGNIDTVRGEYNTEVRPYTGENPGSVYVPRIDANEDALKAADTTQNALARRAVGKERGYDTTAERMTKDSQADFVPETDPAKLLAAHDNALAGSAANETFRIGSGGKTKDAVFDELHPGLKKAKDSARNRVNSLKSKIETAEKRQGGAIKGYKATAAQERAIARRMAPLQERVEALVATGEYGPELSHLSGQLYELRLRAARLAKSPAGGRVVAAGERVGNLTAELDAAQKQLEELVSRYKTAGTGDYVVNRSTYRYHTRAESADIDELLAVSNGRAMDMLSEGGETIRASVLNGDFSPLTIQGGLRALTAPRTFVTTLADVIHRGGASLDEIARTEPEMVGRFTRARMRHMGQVDPEFSGAKGLLARIPGVGRKVVIPAEQKMSNFLQRMDYEIWKKDTALLQRANPDMPVEVADAEAVNALAKIGASLQPGERGVSTARGKIERLTITSTSFLSSPALVIKDATSGLAKLIAHGGDWKALRGREQLALIHGAQVAGTYTAIAGASAMYFAEDRGLTPEEALRRTFTPGTREFMSLSLPGGRNIPLGGPFRSFVVGVSPRWQDGELQPPDLVRFAKSKATPVLGTTIELLQNKDWRNDPIMKGNALEKTWRALEYVAEGLAMPISVSNVAENVRKGGKGIGETIEDALSGFGGQNLSRPSPFGEFDTDVRKDPEFQSTIDPVTGEKKKATGYWDLEEHQQAIADERYGRPPSTNPETLARQQAYAEAKEEKAVEQVASDQLLAEKKITPQQWRNDLRGRTEYLAGFADAKYGDIPMQDRRVTPLDEYYGMINGMKTSDGKVDWDKVDAAAAAKPEHWQAYVDRNMPATTGTETVKGYRTDIRAIADSGYWDMEQGRAEFLRNNPAIREKVAKWGYSPATIRYLEIEDQTRDRQVALDQRKREGMSAAKWKDKYHENMASLRDAGEALFGSGEDKPPTNAIERWFAAIDANEDDVLKEVDWDAVDRWIATQSPEDQAAIAGYSGKSLTPEVARYKEAVKKISAKGYWDLPDKIAQRFVRRFGLQPGASAQDLRQTVYMKWFDMYKQRGMGEFEASERASQRAEDQLKTFEKMVSDQRKIWRKRNRAETYLLAAWGWYDPGEEMGNTLIRYSRSVA